MFIDRNVFFNLLQKGNMNNFRNSPFGQTIYGANFTMPGTPAGPSNIGNFGMNGPDVPFSEWAPRGLNGARAIQAFLNSGLPGSRHIHMTLPSNDFIVHSYPVKPWLDDNAHL